MSSKRSLVVMMAFLVALVASFANAQDKTAKKAAATEEKAPRLTIVDPVKEFGEIAKGDKLDWSFVIKLHALLETAVSQLLVHALGGEELVDVFSALEMSNIKTGKLAFVKTLGLLPKAHL